MKKLILFCVLLAGLNASGQYTYIAQRYEWLAGVFRALGLPAGDSAQFQPSQRQRQGAVYMDTTNTPESPNGFYIYEDPTGGNNPYWRLQLSQAQICGNRLLTDWSVSWQGSGFNYSVHGGQPSGQGAYQIGCSFYTADSLTVTLDSSDDDKERIDVIYLDATGIHVLKGDTATVGTAQKPTVTLDQIELTFVTVSPGTTQPTLTQLIVYNENTESTVTNTGTTTDPNNLTNVYIGLKSVNVTNVNHGDIIDFTHLLAGSWNVLGYDGLSLAIKLKPTMPINTSCQIAVSLVIGTSVVGTEVIVPVTKTNSSTYQQLTVPMSAFGNLGNTNITTVRVRYLFPTAPANIYVGFYLDYIYFVDGLQQPVTPSTPAQFTLNMPTGFTVNPTNTQQSPGTWNVTTQTALPGQYYTKEGWVTLPFIPVAVGTLDGQAKSPNGGSVFQDSIYFQLADSTYPGLLSSELFRKINRNDSVTNGTPGDTLLVKVSDSLLLVKSLIAGTNISFDVGADSIVINSTASGSGTAGEGIAVSGDSIHLGAVIGTAANKFSQDRFIDVNRKGLYLTNGEGVPGGLQEGGVSWDFGQKVFSPYQFISSDTVTANDVDPPTAAVPWSGIFARRDIYYQSPAFRTQKVFGHQFEQRWRWDDTLSLNTQSGDYNAGFSVKNIYYPYGAGRQGVRASHGTGQNNSRAYAAPALLVTNVLKDTVGNWIKVDGHLSGINSYVVMGSDNQDTVGKYIYYTTGGFMSATSNIGISYDFAPASYFASPRVDSAFGWFDTARVKRWYQANKTVIGPSVGTANAWASADQLKVLGNFATTDSMRLGKASLIGDSTGYDWVIRARTDGGLFRIRASDMAAFFGGTSCNCTLAQTLLNDNVSGNQNIFMEGSSSQLVFDYQGSFGHGITFRSGTSIGAATELYIQNSISEDSSFRVQLNAGSPTYADLDFGLLTTGRHIRFPDASGTIALTSDIPAGGGTVNTGTANTLAYYPASTAAVDDLAAITANRALISDANGLPTHSATTATQLGYLSTATSDIQTQLNGKATLALDNLASVQTNADIVPAADNARDMGSSAKAFKDNYAYTFKAKGATSGTITYKSDALANAPNVTNNTGTGYVQVWHEARETSNFTGQNINTVQPMFSTANDVFTAQASTAYDFEIMLSLNHGATSHSVGISFELAGGASLTSISYTSICWVTAIGTNTASQTTNFIQAATNTAVNAAGANATEQIYLKGTINVNAAGTITPSYTFSAAPGGTCVTIAGSSMRFAAKGTNTFTSLGPFN